ncbi:MAG: ATP-binding protein [Candidatus Methanomethylophilaceae archaeon]|nr:ATP-binding protein [Candidatus Methanomethylophilaceae archaeon]
MFVGRDAEMEALNRMYQEDRFHFVPISGRRRVGKTTLIKEFVKDKPFVMFKAVPGNEPVNLSMFNEAVSGDPEPIRLDRILWKAEERSGGGRLVVVIDEYPNLVDGAKHNSGLLNNFIEAVKDRSRLFIIVCGSSMSIMESEVLGKKSPLYGRRTGQMMLRPFSFKTSTEMLKGFSHEEMMTIYGLVGGVPYYLEQFDPGMSLEENIRLRYLDPSCVLSAEPELMFLSEFRKPASYYSVIHAISRGRMTPSEIAGAVGMSPSAVSHLLDNLEMLDMVAKDEPFGVKNSRSPRYRIKDYLLSSYFRFVYPEFSDMDSADVGSAYSRMASRMSEYLGHVFEDICHEFVKDKGFRRCGRWWKGPEEMDLVAVRDGTILFAECRFRNELTDADLIDSLMDRSVHIKSDGMERRYALFSKSGYSRVAEMRAEKDGVVLYTLDDIFGERDAIRDRIMTRPYTVTASFSNTNSFPFAFAKAVMSTPAADIEGTSISGNLHGLG